MRNKGFTLVEVLIVVIIIGILAAIGIPQFADSIEKAKGGEAKAGLGHIQTAEKIYHAENEIYTTDITNDLDVNLSNSRFWSFSVNPATSVGYTAIATRSAGSSRAYQTLTMNQAGVIGGNWDFGKQ